MKQIFNSSRRKLIVAFALLVAAVTLASCTTDGTAPELRGPTLAGPPVIDPSIGSSPIGATLAASLSGEVDDTLKAWKDREKARIADVAVRSKSVYDSLHAIWALTHSKQGGKKRPAATTVAECEPLPYAADVQIVGPAGALFNVGPHKFYIPKGAITTPTVITVELPVTNHSELDFSPHGLRFGTSFIMLDYHTCDVGTSKWREVVYTDDSYNILERPASYDQRTASNVWAAINHFSHYVTGTN